MVGFKFIIFAFHLLFFSFLDFLFKLNIFCILLSFSFYFLTDVMNALSITVYIPNSLKCDESEYFTSYSKTWILGFPGGSDGKESACNAGDLSSIPGFYPWRREWQPTPVFLPGKSYGQRFLVGYSPWGRKSWPWLRLSV